MWGFWRVFDTFQPGLAPLPDRAAPPKAAAPALTAAVRRAQALVDVRPRDLGFRLVVRATRAAVRGQTDGQRRTITLFVDAGDAPHRGRLRAAAAGARTDALARG